MDKRFIPKYSGKKSKRFWDVINKLPKKEQNEMFSLGIILQENEAWILARLNNIIDK